MNGDPPTPSPAMGTLSPAPLCRGALSFLWVPSGQVTARVGFQGCYYIRISCRAGAEKPNFRLYLSPPPKGLLTTVLVRAHWVDTVGAPALRCAAAGPLGGEVHLEASRPMGVRVVTPGGHASLDPALALLRHLLGPCCVVVSPSPQPHDRHRSLPRWPEPQTSGPVLLDGVEHPARRPLLAHLEPFQVLQVQSSGDLLGTGMVATHPFPHEGDKACDHVSKMLSQGL